MASTSMQEKFNLTTVILITSFTVLIAQKANSLTTVKTPKKTSITKLEKDSLSFAIEVAPKLKNSNIKLREKINYKNDLYDYNFLHYSFFSAHDANKNMKYNSLKMLKFNEIETKNAFTFTLLPILDGDDNIETNEFPTKELGTPLSTLLKIKFPLF